MKTRLIGGLLLLAQITYAQLLTFDSTGTLKNPHIIPSTIDAARKIPVYINPSKISPLTANLNKLHQWPGKAGNIVFEEVFPGNQFEQYKALLNWQFSTSLRTRTSYPIVGFVEYNFKTISISLPAAPYINISVSNLYLPLKTLSKPLYDNFKFISLSIPIPPFLITIPDPYWPYKTLKTSTAASPPKISIKRPLYDHEIIVEHLKKTKQLYKHWNPTAPVFTELSRNFKRLSYSIDSLLTIDASRNLAANQPFNIDVLIHLLQLSPYTGVVDENFKNVINDNREWIKSWLWYTGGDLRLNPFPYYNTTPFLKTTYAQKKLVEERIALLKTSVGSGVFSNFSDNEQTLTRLTALLSTINDQLTALKKDSTSSANWLVQTQKKSSVLYEGEVPVSNQEKMNWLVHYKYSKENEKHKVEQLTKKENLPASVAESDQMAAVIHNVPGGTNIDIKANETPIENLTTATEAALEPFATNFLASLQGIENINKVISSLGLVFGATVLGNNSSSLPTPQFNKTDNYSAEFLGSVGLANIDEFTKFLEDIKAELNSKKITNIKSFDDYIRPLNASSILFREYLDIISIIDNYDNWLQNYRKSKQKFEWLAAQSVPLLEIKDFKDDLVPAYRMVVKYPEDSLLLKKSKEVKYTLHIGKEQVCKTSYKKHELIRFWPTVGGGYIPAVRSYYTYDAAKGAPKEEFISHLEAIVGVKYYPFKTNILSTCEERKLIKTQGDWKYNRRRGNHIPLNRLFVFGGLGVTKSIFKNYCLGIGYDIIPGVSLQGGLNFIAQKSYDFDKGKIKREYEHFNRNCYWGISVDLGIITKLIPIFSRN